MARAAASTTAPGSSTSILIKENHAALAGGVGEAVRRARAARPDLPLAVEVRDGAEIDEALEAGAPRLLLDNMTPGAGARRGRARGGPRGDRGVRRRDPETILVYATIDGVDYVSMGALTHSAPVLDLSLSLESLPMTLLSLDTSPPCRTRCARSPPSAAP